MVVVGAGVSSRFGTDKLMAHVAGEPLVVHTIRAVKPVVSVCVLVCRRGLEGRLASLRLGVELAAGGETRTGSEIAGLAALGDRYDLIGIHDAARPLVRPELVDRLFAEAEKSGGAIPVVAPDDLVVERATMSPLSGAMAAQTPQVFRAAELREAFRLAGLEAFEAHDTAEVVSRFTDTTIMAVPGDPDNVKVTYPGDLRLVERLLSESARNAPR